MNLDDEEMFEELELDVPVSVGKYNKLYAVQAFRTKNGIEVFGIIEVGGKES
jgi:hypothetical protein